MSKAAIRVLLQALPLLLPLNIYMIGDWLAVGVQWAFARYQVAVSYENAPSFILPLNREIQYVSSGIIGGKSGIAVFVWTGATVLVIATLLLVLYRPLPDRTVPVRRFVPHLTVLAGILFLASCMLHYGIALYGPGGFAIPIGVPVILLLGYWAFRLDAAEEEEASRAGDVGAGTDEGAS